jgi:hypothetical protein
MQLDDINTNRCENKPYLFDCIIIHQKKKFFYFLFYFKFFIQLSLCKWTPKEKHENVINKSTKQTPLTKQKKKRKRKRIISK